MQKVLLSGFLFLMLMSLAAQTEEVRYFETATFQNERPRSGPFKRTYFKEEGYWIVKSYNRNVLLDSGRYQGFSSLENLDNFLRFHAYDQFYVKSRTTFTDREAEVWQFFKSGKPHELGHYVGDSSAIQQVWTNEGETILTDGQGKREIQLDDGGIQLLIYTDYKLSEALKLRPDKGDTLYLRANNPARPKIGLTAFHRSLASKIKYPEKAQDSGLEATLYVRFVVDKQGVLGEFDLSDKRSQSYGFEKKTLKQLKKLPPWTPAYHKGKPVKTAFVLPIVFRLRD